MANFRTAEPAPLCHHGRGAHFPRITVRRDPARQDAPGSGRRPGAITALKKSIGALVPRFHRQDCFFPLSADDVPRANQPQPAADLADPDDSEEIAHQRGGAVV
jgi:hypothetical protein